MYKIWLSVFGTGYSPIASGTCGSAVVSAIFLIAALCGISPMAMLMLMCGIALHGCIVTILYGDRFIEAFGKDPSQIVSDEQAGQAVTYLGLFAFAPDLSASWWTIVSVTTIGFFAFRFFDIVKPSPVRNLENLPGAWGVLLDDIAAGAYANICLHVVLFYLLQ